MPRARSVALLLATVSLAAPSGALAQGAGGAGDDQYTDPFAETGTTAQSGNGDDNGGDNGLSQNPDLDNGDGTSTGTSTGTGTGTSTTGTTTQSASLANTGSDLRLMILAGLTLVLAGTGLRMRTADEKF